jgi:hypothetical protein
MVSRCGTCAHGSDRVDNLKVVDCYGLPPQPIVMPSMMPNGQVGAQLQFVRPPMERNERGCSLHKPKNLADFDVVANELVSQ